MKNIFIFVLCIPNVLSCSLASQSGNTVNIIPSPLELKMGVGTFNITSSTRTKYCAEARDAVVYLNLKLKTAAGFQLAAQSAERRPDIEFVQAAPKDSLGNEGYILKVTSKRITIRAQSRAGFFYAVQTILQFLPPEIVGSKISEGISWTVPVLIIRDIPKYFFRSFMMDSGRQFQTVEYIKRYLDFLAQLKINIFHWHLTEGQGWRIEIKKYPKLTELGSSVAQGEEQQGFYTQEEIKEVVEYARLRCITVVPEIDLPGHSEAALIAYPELTCFKKAPPTVMEYSSHLFCGGNESTYTFIENILSEVCDLFPGEYIHLGGDEAPKNDWDSCSVCLAKIKQEGLANSHELQIYFSTRLATYLQQREKKCILWGDVIENGGPRMPDNVIIYWWNYRKKLDATYKAAMAMGYPIICGTNYYTYLNFPITPWSRYKEDRTFDLRQAYEGNPSDILQPPKFVIGVGACLWTDWNVKMRMIDQRVFPRLLVLSEQMWSSKEKIPFPEYYEKVKLFYPRLDALGIHYGPAVKEEVPLRYNWE